MPLTGKLTSALLCSTMLGGPIMSVAATGALLLLTGENEGFAIDATTYDSITAATYTGGPVGGTVAIKEYDSPAALMSNVALDDPRSPLVQSGTSPKMVLCGDAQGDSPGSTYPLVRWTPHNLCPDSQTVASWAGGFGNANITVTSNDTTAPDGTSTADKITATDTTSAYMQTTDVTIVVGPVYTYSVYVKYSAGDWFEFDITDRVTGNIRAWFNVSSGTLGTTTGSGAVGSSITSVGSGWYRCSLTFNYPTGWATTWCVRHKFADTDGSDNTPDVGDEVWLWGAQLVRGYNANPYLVTTTAARYGIPQEYDTAASKFGILVEPAATNELLRSEELDNASWGANWQITVSANSTTAPNGASTADKVIPDATNANHDIGQNFTASGTGTFTFSIFAKNAGYGWVELIIGQAGLAKFASRSFNIATGATGTDRGATYTIASSSSTDVGDGWRRFSITVVTDTTSATAHVTVSSADNFTTGFTANGTDGVYLWGAMFESGSVATSYIPTLGSTVTRAVDALTVPVSAIPLSTTEETRYHDFKLLKRTDNDSLSGTMDGGGAVLICFYTAGSIYLYGGGSNSIADTNTTAAAAGVRSQFTASAKANDSDISLDGAAIVSDNTCTMIGAQITDVGIGGRQGGGNPMHGYLYRFVLVPRKVADGDLPTWRYS